jgi:hypothetical protein
MKACAEHKKELALLAIDALEEPAAESLRAHVETCLGCRSYLRELDEVAANMRRAEAPETDLSPFLLRRVRPRLLEERPLPKSPWRLLVSAAAAIVFILFIYPRVHPKVALPPPTPAPVSAVKSIDQTVLNYQMAANQSLERLDAILTEQGKRPLPATPTYRAGSLGDAAD